MAFLLPQFYRRRFLPEIQLADIQLAQTNLAPQLETLHLLDTSLRALISSISRTWNIPIPGAGLGPSSLTSPSSPTGDLTHDSARLLLLYLRAVLSKGYLRELDRTNERLRKFERQYWDEDEGEATNAGFWKRCEIGEEALEEGVGMVRRWGDRAEREREWLPKIKEMEEAIREAQRWERDVAVSHMNSRVGSLISAGVLGGSGPRSVASSILGNARGGRLGGGGGGAGAGSSVNSITTADDDDDRRASVDSTSTIITTFSTSTAVTSPTTASHSAESSSSSPPSARTSMYAAKPAPINTTITSPSFSSPTPSSQPSNPSTPRALPGIREYRLSRAIPPVQQPTRRTSVSSNATNNSGASELERELYRSLVAGQQKQGGGFVDSRERERERERERFNNSINRRVSSGGLRELRLVSTSRPRNSLPAVRSAEDEE